MFNNNDIFKGPKIGRQHFAVRPNGKGEGFVLQLATRTETGYTYDPPVGPIFIHPGEARKYRRKYIYKDKDLNGGFHPDPLATYPLFCLECGHIRYRDHTDVCIQDGCPFVAYQIPGEFK